MLSIDALGYNGKTIVVTGGSSGMGEAVVQILNDLGAKVHIVDIQAPKVSCEGYYPCDMANFAQVREVAAQLKALAPIDFLFPCAGIPPHLAGALQCMKVNYIGARHFIEHLEPSLAEGAGIALISSDAAMGWQKNLAQNLEMLAISDPEAAVKWVEEAPETRLRDGYTTSKEMLAVWVQNAAVKLGNARRIRLNATGPCPTKTAFMEQSEHVLGEGFLDSWPYPSLGRMATATEQAWPLILLNSPLNAAVTGSFLYTDQGFASGVMTGAIDMGIMGGGKGK